MTRDDRDRASSTDAVHAGVDAVRAGHTLAPAVAQTATFSFESSADLERYMRGEDPDPDREEYGRYGNPTVRELERRVAALDGGADAAAFASGMCAVSTTLLALLQSGDHVVLFRDCYRRTRQLLIGPLARYGVSHTLLPPGDLDALESALRPETKLVIAESPTNPYLYCTDLERLAAIAKAHGKVRTLVDATFATPVNCRPLRFGVDLVLHSGTKYLAGHNDVLAGFVTVAPHLISLIREARGVLGGVLDPHAAFLVGRGIKTLALRVERQNRTALAVARALASHAAVEGVYYPTLESHPSHAIAARQLAGGGGVVSFVVRGGRTAASRVVDRCRLATIAPSLGGVETLIEQPALMSYFDLDDAGLAAIGVDPALIRFSVGIEETEDVVNDLLAALEPELTASRG
jgi:cystathionine gamma-synthase